MALQLAWEHNFLFMNIWYRDGSHPLLLKKHILALVSKAKLLLLLLQQQNLPSLEDRTKKQALYSPLLTWRPMTSKLSPCQSFARIKDRNPYIGKTKQIFKKHTQKNLNCVATYHRHITLLSFDSIAVEDYLVNLKKLFCFMSLSLN